MTGCLQTLVILQDLFIRVTEDKKKRKEKRKLRLHFQTQTNTESCKKTKEKILKVLLLHFEI